MRKHSEKGKLQNTKRILALLLCACMVGTSIPAMTYAAEANAQGGSTDGLCEHHTAHTADCGYEEGKSGSTCTYVCEECRQGIIGQQTSAEETKSGGTASTTAANANAAIGSTEEGGTASTTAATGSTEEGGTANATAATDSTEEGSIASTTAENASVAAANTTYKVTAWEWIDEEANLNPEDGALVLSAEEENPCPFDCAAELLPTQVKAWVYQTADVEDEEDAAAGDGGNAQEAVTLTLGAWECENYPAEGAYCGSYTFRTTLPEGYELAGSAGPLEIPVRFDTPQMLDTTAWGGTVAGAFAGGDGSQSSPYQIAGADQLAYLAQVINVGTAGYNTSGTYYQLTADINLGDNDWTPIGDSEAHAFQGHFDGNGKTITINNSTTSISAQKWLQIMIDSLLQDCLASVKMQSLQISKSAARWR